jgi:hypothetical protein
MVYGDMDDGSFLYGHLLILRIFHAQEMDTFFMSRASGKNPCPPSNQNIGQLRPIFFVSIDDNGNIRIFTNVSDPFQQERCDSFGLRINGGVYLRILKGIADGHNQGVSPGAGGCQMSHPPSA